MILLRWGIAEEALNSNRSGIVVKNPDGTDTELVTFSYEGGGNTQTLYSSAAAVYGFETLNMVKGAGLSTIKFSVQYAM